MSQKTSLYSMSSKDFSRNRKLPFKKLIKFIIGLQGQSICKEIFDYFKDSELMTPSAFVQQRAKLKSNAFKYIFHEFNNRCIDTMTTDGYRLYAFDGSDLNVPSNDNPYSHIAHLEKGYDMFHINALYDISNDIYSDIIIQPVLKTNEPGAAVQMVDRYEFPHNSIILADRGYAALNLLEHINRKDNVDYLFRCKNDYVSEIKELPFIELDKEISFELRTTQTLEDKEAFKNGKAKFISGKSKFGKYKKTQSWDFESSHTMTIRVVRFQLSTGEYETIITSLDRFRFPIDKIKNIYHMRWNIENSFRTLKYAVGMINLHSTKENSILQEIWSSFIMYNLSSRIASKIIIEKNNTKWSYKVDMALVIHICFSLFRTFSISGEPPPSYYNYIKSNLLPIRPNRKDERKMTPKKVVCFNYRVS